MLIFFFTITRVGGVFPPSVAIAYTTAAFFKILGNLGEGITCLARIKENYEISVLGYEKRHLFVGDQRRKLDEILKNIFYSSFPLLLVGIQNLASAARLIKLILDVFLPFVLFHFDAVRRSAVIAGLSSLQNRVSSLQKSSGQEQRVEVGSIELQVNSVLASIQQKRLIMNSKKEDTVELEQIAEQLKKLPLLFQKVPQKDPQKVPDIESSILCSEVKEVCQQFCTLLSDARKQRFSTLTHDQLTLLKQIRDQISPTLEKLAGNDSAADNSPCQQLGALGLRTHDFMSIARGIHWSSDDEEFLALKFAEREIFTKQNLDDKILKYLQHPYDMDELQTAVIQVLNGNGVSLGIKADSWKPLKLMASKVARIAATIFLWAYHALAFHNLYMYPGSSFSLFSSLDAYYRGWSGKMCYVYPERFIAGDFESRVTWILDASEPLSIFTQTFAYSCFSQEGPK